MIFVTIVEADLKFLKLPFATCFVFWNLYMSNPFILVTNLI